MRELSEWAASTRFPDRPWLILGKGPTFSRRADFDLGAYNLISLNHAVLQQSVDIAHLVDLSVVEDCGDALLRNSRFVLIPRHPHVAFGSSIARLEDFVPHMPVLRELDRQDRLVWYNAATGPAEGGGPVIDLRYFSSEAALGIVAHLGASVVRSLGVDGSRGYSSQFETYSKDTLLSNRQPSFNAQFARLDLISDRHRVDYRPLVPPMRVFIGTDPAQRVAAEVLEHSLHTHATAPIRVQLLDQPLTHVPRDARSRPRTPFSFNRFLIPSLMGFEGTALYLDSDMLVFDDVSQLFSLPFGPHAVLCTRQPSPPAQWRDHPDFKAGRQFSVMLIDCARARWEIEDVVKGLDSGLYTYEELMFDLALVPDDQIDDSIPAPWNHLERYKPDITKLLHFTVVPTQPWRNDKNPLRTVWLDAFERALDGGAINRVQLAKAVENGSVAPDLLRFFERPGADEAAGSPQTPIEIELRAARDRLTEIESRAVTVRPSQLRPVQALRQTRSRLRRRWRARR